VRSGVPFDVAFQLDDVTRAAWCIISCEHEGRTFDWSRMEFKEQE
jgi:hypothetical protein